MKPHYRASIAALLATFGSGIFPAFGQTSLSTPPVGCGKHPDTLQNGKRYLARTPGFIISGCRVIVPPYDPAVTDGGQNSYKLGYLFTPDFLSSPQVAIPLFEGARLPVPSGRY